MNFPRPTRLNYLVSERRDEIPTEFSDPSPSVCLGGPPWTIFHTFINSTVIFGGFHYKLIRWFCSPSPTLLLTVFHFFLLFHFHTSFPFHPFGVLFTIRTHFHKSKMSREKKETWGKSSCIFSSPHRKKQPHISLDMPRSTTNMICEAKRGVLVTLETSSLPASFIHSSTPSTNFHFSRRASMELNGFPRLLWCWFVCSFFIFIPFYPCSIEHDAEEEALGWERESEKRVEEKLKIYNRFDGYGKKIQVSCELYRAAVCTLLYNNSRCERGDVPLLLLPLLLLRWKINKLK